jgi:hypothetical protein
MGITIPSRKSCVRTIWKGPAIEISKMARIGHAPHIPYSYSFVIDIYISILPHQNSLVNNSFNVVLRAE